MTREATWDLGGSQRFRFDDLGGRGGRRGELEALCEEIGEPEIAKRMPL